MIRCGETPKRELFQIPCSFVVEWFLFVGCSYVVFVSLVSFQLVMVGDEEQSERGLMIMNHD